MRVKIEFIESGKLQKLNSQLGEIMRRASIIARRAICSWYGKLPEDYFDNPAPYPDGTPRHGNARAFMRPLATAWEAEEITGNSFTLSFHQNREGGAPWGLRLHHYGGRISRKNALALTIPMTAEAHGMRAAEFSRRHNLFRVKNILAYTDSNGALHAAYALVQTVYVPSLYERRGHGAIPSEKELADMGTDAIANAFNQIR